MSDTTSVGVEMGPSLPFRLPRSGGERLALRAPLHPGLPAPPLLTSALVELEAIHSGQAAARSIEGERFRFDAQVRPAVRCRSSCPMGAPTT